MDGASLCFYPYSNGDPVTRDNIRDLDNDELYGLAYAFRVDVTDGKSRDEIVEEVYRALSRDEE